MAVGLLRWPLLASTLLVTGCANLPFFGPGSAAPPPPAPQATVQSDLAPGPINEPVAPVVPPSGPKVGLLLPLSGPNGSLGESMLRAARLALNTPGAPLLDPHDTAGPEGAAHAATLAVQSHDGIILGPLTSADTAGVAPIAQSANVPVLAFTSDVAQARPGVWVMGVTPEQQVRRLVFAAKADGRTRLAALLPASALGQALADGLTHACADAGLPPPTILTHAGTADSIDATMKQLSDFTTRQAAAAQQAGAAAPGAVPVPGNPAPGAVSAVNPDPGPVPGQAPAAVAAAGGTPGSAPASAPPAPLPPPPFDALLLGDTGLQLAEVITALHNSSVMAPQVRILGPGLWGAFASKLHALAGAWYAAPDPSNRLGFVEAYQAAYHQSPKLLADYPYDAAAMARSLASRGYDTADLTRTDGFAGVDGVFALQPDGHVHRSLAIFQVLPGGGASIVQHAPASLSDMGS